jgi:hypothetical protein
MTENTEKQQEKPVRAGNGEGAMSPNVTLAPSIMSPGDLAAEEARWRADGRPLVGQVFPKLPPMAATAGSRRRLPETWNVVHVLDRLEEAFEVLAMLPMNTRPRGYANSMPVYTYERSDLIAQVETGELDRMMRTQNRVRLGASADQIARTEEALRWCMIYLPDSPEVARAVQLSALWAAMRVDANRRCKALKINRKAFYRRKMHGLNMLTIELMRHKVPVR